MPEPLAMGAAIDPLALTAREAAAALRISESKLRRLRDRGLIPFNAHLGRYPFEALRAFVNCTRNAAEIPKESQAKRSGDSGSGRGSGAGPSGARPIAFRVRRLPGVS
jgi:hypothetical protein